MRGAQPDAECVRCGARFPPSADGRLVTCAACGLVFEPHELQHPYRPGEVAVPAAPPTPAMLDAMVAKVGNGVSVTTLSSRHVQISQGVTSGIVVGALCVAALGLAAVPALALGLVAASLLLLFSRSTFTLAGDTASVRRFPFSATATFARTDVTSFVVVHRHDVGARPVFDVRAQLHDGGSIVVVRAIRRRAADLLVLWLTLRLANRPAVG